MHQALLVALIFGVVCPGSASPSYPNCQGLPGGITFDSFVANRPISQFDATGSIGPFPMFFVHRDRLWEWPACVSDNPPSGYTPPTPLHTSICPLSITPFASVDHPYATAPDCPVASRRHNGAHINFHSSEFPPGLDNWPVEIQSPTSGKIVIKGADPEVCLHIDASSDQVNPGLLTKSNIDIQFAKNDRVVPPATLITSGRWDFHMSIESQHTDVICVRQDRSWVWADRGLFGSDADNDAAVAGLSDNFLEIMVQAGDCVRQGDVIAKLPVKTGATRTPHVHFHLATSQFALEPSTNKYCPNLFDHGTVDKARDLMRHPRDPCTAGAAADWDELVTAAGANQEPPPAFCFDYDDDATAKFNSMTRPISDNLLPNNQ